ncbi:hypothetical protein C8Q77DRAFT_471286 [Trametes polyzona]|nr:hypothetical protein C8Q77DRAFT_471286 [Trametes polyzona]
MSNPSIEPYTDMKPVFAFVALAAALQASANPIAVQAPTPAVSLAAPVLTFTPEVPQTDLEKRRLLGIIDSIPIVGPLLGGLLGGILGGGLLGSAGSGLLGGLLGLAALEGPETFATVTSVVAEAAATQLDPEAFASFTSAMAAVAATITVAPAAPTA